MNNDRSSFGIAELILGILLILLGIFTFVNPQSFIRWVIVVYGIIALITGISDIVFYVKTTRYTGFGPIIALITGLLSAMAGLMMIIYPGAGSWVIILLLPIWIIAHCISRLCHINAIGQRSGKFYYYFSLIINILGIVLGVIMIFSPSFSLLTVGFVVGSCMIVIGIEMIINAIGALKAKF